LLTLFVLFALVFLTRVDGSKVKDLNNDNFDTVVDGSIPAFVEFFAPWCGHCKNLAPEYEIVGDSFASHSSKVNIAKVDCDQNGPLCESHGVSGFPTLKWFPTKDSESYEGGRTADDIIKFINEKTGLNVHAKKPPTKSLVLTPDNFDKTINSGKFVFVEFYAPWCGHCKKLAPTWEKFAAVFENEPNVVIAKIDANEHQDLGTKYEIQGFPTLVLFTPEHPKGEKYDGETDLEALVEHINSKAGTQRTQDGLLDRKAGKLADFDALAAKFSTDDRKTLLQKAKELSTGLPPHHAGSALVYVKTMERIIENGLEYVTNEITRLTRMMSTSSSSISASKKDDFQKRINIVNSFQDAKVEDETEGDKEDE